MTSIETVIDAIGGMTFGPETRFEHLTLVPIFGGDDRHPDYLTLDEALAEGSAEVTEVSGAGQVSQLKVVVKGAVPVLLLDGEELAGAKQNRVRNLTILARARQSFWSD